MEIDFLTPAQALVAGLEFSDVYLHPSYGRSAEFIDGGKCEIAVDRETGLSFTYIKRPIGETCEYDIVTPYGYGGFSNPSGLVCETLKEFRAKFLDVSRDRGLIAEFLRLNPLDSDNEIIAQGSDVVACRATFGSFITDPDLEFANTSTAHRGAVRKAAKNDVLAKEVDVSELLNSESAFRELYRTNMERLNSRAELRMPQEYYQALLDLPHGTIRLVYAVMNTSVVAAAIFLVWGDRVHYHLSSANDAGRQVQATDLLIDYAMREFGGLPKILHVGGGLSEADGLEKFKRRATSSEFQLRLCSNVVNRPRYVDLCKGFQSRNYFPSYRDPDIE